MPIRLVKRAYRLFMPRSRRLTVPYSRALAAARRGAARRPYPKGVTQKGVVKAIIRARRKRGTLYKPRVGKVSPKQLGLTIQKARQRMMALRKISGRK